jgi:hypothetical protein
LMILLVAIQIVLLFRYTRWYVVCFFI